MAFRAKRQWSPTAQTWSVRQGQSRQGITVRGRDFICTAGSSDDVTLKLKRSYDREVFPSDSLTFPWRS